MPTHLKVVLLRKVNVMCHSQLHVIHQDGVAKLRLEPVLLAGAACPLAKLIHPLRDSLEGWFEIFVDGQHVNLLAHHGSNRYSVMIWTFDIGVWSLSKQFGAFKVPGILDEANSYPE